MELNLVLLTGVIFIIILCLLLKQINLSLKNINNNLKTVSNHFNKLISSIGNLNKRLVHVSAIIERQLNRLEEQINQHQATNKPQHSQSHKQSFSASTEFPVKRTENRTLCRSKEARYFYIRQSQGIYQLFIYDHILKKKPDPSYDSLFSPFFEVVAPGKKESEDRYKLIKPALVKWNERENRGEVIKKGIIQID